MKVLQKLKQYFSPAGITIIAALLSIFLARFFVGGVLGTILPPSSRLAGVVVGAYLSFPLLIVWVITIAVLARKIYQGSRKASILLILILLLTGAMDIYSLARDGKLFKIPFLGSGKAPLTFFEKFAYEKQLGFQLYIPTYLPENLRPYFHSVRQQDECPVLRLAFTSRGTAGPIPLRIEETRPNCIEKIFSLKTFGGEIYEPVKIQGHTREFYYHTASKTKSNSQPRYHHIEKDGTLIILITYSSPYTPGAPLKEELVKIVQSLE